MENSHYKLLVIGDETDLRQRIVTNLEKNEFDVYDAADSASGLAIFNEIMPDLVITDINTSDADDLFLLKPIHTILPSTPVIVIAGEGVMGDALHALRLGAADYLTKPIVDMEVLLYAVYKGLERSRLLIENELYRIELEEVNTQLTRHIAVLEQDQRAGHFVQQSMLPVSPFYAADYVCEHKVIPSLYLSGDCIDYTYTQQRYYAFYLADVAGHGSAPAFVTIWLKNLVAQLVRLKKVLEHFDSESTALIELLNVINEELLGMGINNHLTIMIGILDTQTDTLFYVVAGHLPLPVLLHDGKAEFLQGNGKPIGLFDKASWEVHKQQLPHQAFSLLLFSDGILEQIQTKDIIEKEQALLKLVEQTEGNLDAIVSCLHIDSVQELLDDVAMLSIRKVIDVC